MKSGGNLGSESVAMIQYCMRKKLQKRIIDSFKILWDEGIQLKEVNGLSFIDYLFNLYLAEEISHVRKRGYF